MKKMMSTLGLAAIIGIIGVGCQKDTIKKEYTISGEQFNQEVGRIADWYQYATIDHKPIKFAVYSESTWRDYPSAGKALPRAEIKEYVSGKMTADLYFPVK